MKIIMIKRYFKTLLTAFLGMDPYRQELEQVRSKYEETARDVRALHDLYYICRGREEQASQQIVGLQKLVELLRDRIKEKDELIEQMKSDYRRQLDNYEKRVGDYSLTIDKLRKQTEDLQRETERKKQ